MSNITIPLVSRQDKNNQIFYIGKTQLPMYLEADDGLAFLVFTSDPGAEEIQIGPIHNNGQSNGFFNKHSISEESNSENSRIRVSLDRRLDQDGRRYYLAKLKFDGLMSCRQGITFLVYTSREGTEELQIVTQIEQQD